MKTKTPQYGIREQIKNASNKKELVALMGTLNGYEYASPKTVRRCQKEAQVKLKTFAK